MARQVTCGFEHQAVTTTVDAAEGQGYRTIGSPSIETTTVRSGAASLKVASGTTAQTCAIWQISSWPNGTYVPGRTYYLRFYFRASAAVPNATQILVRFEAATGSTRLAELRWLITSGTLSLRNGSAAQVAVSGALNANQWYRVEILFKQAASARSTTNGTLELRVDGVSQGGLLTGVDAGTLDLFRVMVGLAAASTNGVVNMFFDDVAVNDDSDSPAAQSGYPGPGKIVLLKPTSDVSRTGWTNGTGGTTNLFDALDNTPPTGKASGSALATDQIKDSSAANDAYIAALTTYAAAGIAGVDAIALLEPLFTISNNTSTARNMALRTESNPDDTANELATFTNGIGAAGTFPLNWWTKRGHLVLSPSVTLGTAPQLRVRKVDAVDEQEVAALGLYVEYNPPLSALLGQPSETDTAQALTHAKRLAIGQASETDLAQALTHRKTRAIGQAAETDTAQALTHAKTVRLGQASEVDVAQSVARTKTGHLGQASEVDAAQPVAHTKVKAIGQASEVDAAQPVAARRIRAIGQASEVDVARPASRVKAHAIGQANEVDAAQPVSRVKTRAIGQASEVDAAQPAGRVKARAIGQASEADVAQPAFHTKVKAVGQASETDLSQPVVHAKIRAIGQASEADAAQPASRVKARAIGQASEVDVAQFALHTKIKAVGQASETDLAQPVVHAKVKAIGQASETDLAQAATHARAVALGLASEVDTARAITSRKTLAIGQTLEIDVAQNVSVRGHISAAFEVDSAQPVHGYKARAVGQASEVDLATAFGALHSRQLGQAFSTDQARPVTILRVRQVGQAAETDAAPAMLALRVLTIGEALEADQVFSFAGGAVRLVHQADEVDSAGALATVGGGRGPGYRERLDPGRIDLDAGYRLDGSPGSVSSRLPGWRNRLDPGGT